MEFSQKKHSRQEIPDDLFLIRQCPGCKQDFEKKYVRVLSQRSDAHLIHITCQHCQQAVIALVMLSPVGLGSVGIATDLKAGEALRFHDRSHFVQDDVLSFHSFLQKDDLVERHFSHRYISA
ncbi:MAG: hypothetical protein ABII02_04790 [Candidatus Magasanikbacteria bacterium]